MEKPRHPVSGVDYPGTFQEFDHWFSNEDACLQYITKLRWPKGFVCPGCSCVTEKPSLMGRGLFLCRKCKRQTSVTAGTLFHNVSAASLRRFVSIIVRKRAEVRTDGWSGYKSIEKLEYRHVVKNISESGHPAQIAMPRVHQVASPLDRWWLGIHQGAIRPSHLDYYLDEFTFRFNRRSSRARGLLFYRLMEHAVDCAPVPRQKIIGGRPQDIVGG
jgi:hypothetical protein